MFGEACVTGDMTYIAIRLSQWGIGDNWEDVDRYVRNHLSELQYRDPDLMASVVSQMPPLDPQQAEPTVDSTDDVVNRTVGCYFSDGSHPSIIPEHTLVNVICCTGNCTKALYEAWNAIVDCQSGQAQINLLLNRASPWLDIDSYLPYQGKVVIHNKTAQSLAVRIPQWVDRSAVNCEIAGQSVPFHLVGNYLQINQIGSEDTITITFEIVETTEQYTLLWKMDDFWKECTNPGDSWQPLPDPDVYTCRFRGNTLVEISPRPDRLGYPLYADRTCYDAPNAPIVTVQRFVAENSAAPGECRNRPPADINGDCKINIFDLAVLANNWLQNGTVQ